MEPSEQPGGSGDLVVSPTSPERIVAVMEELQPNNENIAEVIREECIGIIPPDSATLILSADATYEFNGKQLVLAEGYIGDEVLIIVNEEDAPSFYLNTGLQPNNHEFPVGDGREIVGTHHNPLYIAQASSESGYSTSSNRSLESSDSISYRFPLGSDTAGILLFPSTSEGVPSDDVKEETKDETKHDKLLQLAVVAQDLQTTDTKNSESVNMACTSDLGNGSVPDSVSISHSNDASAVATYLVEEKDRKEIFCQENAPYQTDISTLTKKEISSLSASVSQMAIVNAVTSVHDQNFVKASESNGFTKEQRLEENSFDKNHIEMIEELGKISSVILINENYMQHSNEGTYCKLSNKSEKNISSDCSKTAKSSFDKNLIEKIDKSGEISSVILTNENYMQHSNEGKITEFKLSNKSENSVPSNHPNAEKSCFDKNHLKKIGESSKISSVLLTNENFVGHSNMEEVTDYMLSNEKENSVPFDCLNSMKEINRSIFCGKGESFTRESNRIAELSSKEDSSSETCIDTDEKIDTDICDSVDFSHKLSSNENMCEEELKDESNALSNDMNELIDTNVNENLYAKDRPFVSKNESQITYSEIVETTEINSCSEIATPSLKENSNSKDFLNKKRKCVIDEYEFENSSSSLNVKINHCSLENQCTEILNSSGDISAEIDVTKISQCTYSENKSKAQNLSFRGALTLVNKKNYNNIYGVEKIHNEIDKKVIQDDSNERMNYDIDEKINQDSIGVEISLSSVNNEIKLTVPNEVNHYNISDEINKDSNGNEIHHNCIGCEINEDSTGSEINKNSLDNKMSEDSIDEKVSEESVDKILENSADNKIVEDSSKGQMDDSIESNGKEDSTDCKINNENVGCEMNEVSADCEMNKDGANCKMNEGSADGKMNEGSADGKLNEGSADGKLNEGSADGKLNEGSADGKMNEGSADGKMNEGSADRKMNEGSADWEMNEDSADWEMNEDSADWEMNEGSADCEIDESSTDSKTNHNSDGKRDKSKANSKIIEDNADGKMNQNSADSKENKDNDHAMNQVRADVKMIESNADSKIKQDSDIKMNQGNGDSKINEDNDCKKNQEIADDKMNVANADSKMNKHSADGKINYNDRKMNWNGADKMTESKAYSMIYQHIDVKMNESCADDEANESYVDSKMNQHYEGDKINENNVKKMNWDSAIYKINESNAGSKVNKDSFGCKINRDSADGKMSDGEMNEGDTDVEVNGGSADGDTDEDNVDCKINQDIIDSKMNQGIVDEVNEGSVDEVNEGSVDDEVNEGIVFDEVNEGIVDDEVNEGSVDDEVNEGSVDDEVNEGSTVCKINKLCDDGKMNEGSAYSKINWDSPQDKITESKADLKMNKYNVGKMNQDSADGKVNEDRANDKINHINMENVANCGSVDDEISFSIMKDKTNYQNVGDKITGINVVNKINHATVSGIINGDSLGNETKCSNIMNEVNHNSVGVKKNHTENVLNNKSIENYNSSMLFEDLDEESIFNRRNKRTSYFGAIQKSNFEKAEQVNKNELIRTNMVGMRYNKSINSDEKIGSTISNNAVFDEMSFKSTETIFNMDSLTSDLMFPEGTSVQPPERTYVRKKPSLMIRKTNDIGLFSNDELSDSSYSFLREDNSKESTNEDVKHLNSEAVEDEDYLVTSNVESKVIATYKNKRRSSQRCIKKKIKIMNLRSDLNPQNLEPKFVEDPETAGWGAYLLGASFKPTNTEDVPETPSINVEQEKVPEKPTKKRDRPWLKNNSHKTKHQWAKMIRSPQSKFKATPFFKKKIEQKVKKQVENLYKSENLDEKTTPMQSSKKKLVVFRHVKARKRSASSSASGKLKACGVKVMRRHVLFRQKESERKGFSTSRNSNNYNYSCLYCDYESIVANNIIFHSKFCLGRLQEDVMYCSNCQSSDVINNMDVRQRIRGEDFYLQLGENHEEMGESSESETPDDEESDCSCFDQDGTKKKIEEAELQRQTKKEKVKKYGFADRDVIWAKVKHRFWPAIVWKIDEIETIIYLIGYPSKYVGLHLRTDSLTGQWRSFDDAKWNKKILEDAVRYKDNDTFVKAVQKCDSYTRKIFLDDVEIDPFDYFSFPRNRMLFMPEDVRNEVEEPLVPLQPQEMKELEMDELDEDNEKIMSCILDGCCDDHLVSVYQKEVSSERHEMYFNKDKGCSSRLKDMSWFAPFKKDPAMQIKLSDYFFDVFRSRIGDPDDMTPYINEVWIPEAIIKAISIVKNLDMDDAEHVFFKQGTENGISDNSEPMDVEETD